MFSSCLNKNKVVIVKPTSLPILVLTHTLKTLITQYIKYKKR